MAAPSCFVACTDLECPLNEDRKCRSTFLSIDELGCCVLRNNGPYDPKSPTDNYVEIAECLCQKCEFWELDEALGIGKCGRAADLSFMGERDSEGFPYCVCREIAGQINPPKFSRGTATP